MGIMVYSLLRVLQDLYHSTVPQRVEQRLPSEVSSAVDVDGVLELVCSYQ